MKKMIRLAILLATLSLGLMAIPAQAQVRCDGNENTILDGTTQCRVISGRGEGLASDREARIIRAVDIYDPNLTGDKQAAVCLRGEGALVRITKTNPRQAFWAFPVQGEAGYTCTRVGEQAIIVLLNMEYPEGALGSGSAPTTGGSTAGGATTGGGTAAGGTGTTTGTGTSSGTNAPRFTLDNCIVVTNAILNFRSEPSLSSSVKALIPYNLALRAIDRQGDWYNVIFESDNGWIAASRVTTRGNCTGTAVPVGTPASP